MEMMAVEVGMEVTAWVGMTRIVVLTFAVVIDDSNVHTKLHSPTDAESRPTWAPS